MKKGDKRDGNVFGFAVLFNDVVFREPALRKLLEEEYMTGDLAARYRRRCEQLHKRYRYFNPRPTAEWLVQDTAEVEQHPLGKLAAWALTSDTKAADLAKQVQYIKKSLEWGFVILVALISYLHWR